MSEIQDFLNRAKTSVERGKVTIQQDSSFFNGYWFNDYFASSSATMVSPEPFHSVTINPEFNPWEVNGDEDHSKS